MAALAIALPAALLPSAARAADDETTQPIEITSTSFSKKTVEATEGVQLTLGFALPNNVFHDGFTSKLQLPDGFVFYTDASFDIRSTSGDVIEHATMQRGANTMAFVYTDYVDHHSNITGTMTFSFMMNPHNEPANGPTPFDVLIDGNHVPCGTIDVITMQGDDPNETFAKYGWQDAKTPEPAPTPTEPTPTPTEPIPTPTQPSVTPTPQPQPTTAPTQPVPSAPTPRPASSATPTASPVAATGSNIAWICGIAAIAAVIAAILLIVAMRRRG